MCGIAGWIDFNRDIKYETNTVRKMGETLAPRGPDQQGVYAAPHCCFAHRRLIVIDPQNGRQPMHRDGCTICYNGELSVNLCKRILRPRFVFGKKLIIVFHVFSP